MQVVVQGILSNYTDSGKGERVVLCLHGWADSSRSFSVLGKELKGFRVVCLDLPGFGASEAPGVAWGLDEYASFVADFSKKIGVNVYAIVGHSNGGAIAIKAISKGLIKPQRLVLLASAGIRRPKSFRNTALKLTAKSGKLIMHVAPKRAKSVLRQKFYKKIGSDYLVVEHMQETFKRVVSEDVLSDAQSIKVKTCLVYGDQDQDTPQVYGTTFAGAIENSKLHVVQEAGHFVHLDRTDEVAKILNGFLA